MNYNEKLRLAKEALASGSYDKKTIEYLFPELKETEDERMRKCVKRLINGLTEEHFLRCGASVNEIHTWLEQKPVIEGTFVNIEEVREAFMQEVYRVLDADSTNDRANQIIYVFDHLPTITIQKPAEWSEEDERLLSKLQTYVDIECFDRECNGEDILNWLKSLKERYTWKPSDEQMEALLKLEEMHVLEHEKNQENAHLYMVIKSLREQLLKFKKG